MEFLTTILKKYTQGRNEVKKGFFSSFFKTTEEDYTNGEFVKIDTERTTNTVAPTLRDLRTGAVIVKSSSWDAGRFRPPYVAIKDPIDLTSLMERKPGETEDAKKIVSWFGRLARDILETLHKFHKMISLQVELQAAQILQTGKLTLKDDQDNTTYNLDFGASPSHFPTTLHDWGGGSDDPMGDVATLADKIADDAQKEPAISIFDDKSWKAICANSDFQTAVSKNGLGLGTLHPGLRKLGGVFHGVCDFGSHKLELWTFNGTYQTLANSTPQKYLADNKVIIMAAPEDVDFRTVYACIPTLGMKEPFTDVVPSEVTYGDEGEGTGFIRVVNRVYEDESLDTYTAEAKSRPLSIPVSIDAFGCLTTKQ